MHDYTHVRTMKVTMAAMMVMLGAREDMIDPRKAAFWSSLLELCILQE